MQARRRASELEQARREVLSSGAEHLLTDEAGAGEADLVKALREAWAAWAVVAGERREEGRLACSRSAVVMVRSPSATRMHSPSRYLGEAVVLEVAVAAECWRSWSRR